MTYTFDEIRELVTNMEKDQGPLLAKMRDILVRYDGDWVIPLVDVDKEPTMPHISGVVLWSSRPSRSGRSRSPRAVAANKSTNGSD